MGEVAAREPPERDREQRVGRQVEDVGPRVAVGVAEAAHQHVVEDVAGGEEDDAGREQLPHAPCRGAVAGEPPHGAGCGDHGEEVPEEGAHLGVPDEDAQG